ncbi:MAG TPA: hypothetical protein VGE15_12310 [Sphingobacteriaceae bacterium]
MKKAGFTIVTILAVAAATYTYFNYMFYSLSDASLFDDNEINGYL